MAGIVVLLSVFILFQIVSNSRRGVLKLARRRCVKKVIDQAERDISTTELHALLHFYPWPINVVVYHDPSGRTHLGRGLALRCFQRLSFPNIATQQCR